MHRRNFLSGLFQCVVLAGVALRAEALFGQPAKVEDGKPGSDQRRFLELLKECGRIDLPGREIVWDVKAGRWVK